MRTARPNVRARLGSAALAALIALWPAAGGAQTAATIVVPAPGGEAWTPDGIAALTSDLDALLATGPALRGAHVGVIVADSASGNVLYAHNAEDEFQPASTLKLLVGSAALDRFGPGFRFRTRLETAALQPGSGAPPVDAVVLRAGGDPFLGARDVDEAAGAVAAAGVSGLRGAFIDDSHDDAEPYAPGWTWDDFAYDYAPRISAMTYEENVAHLTVAPGAGAGRAAIVRAEAPAEVRSPAEGCEAVPRRAIEIVARVRTVPAGTASTVDVDVGRDGCLEATGVIPLGGPPESVDAAVDDPLLYAQTALLRALRALKVMQPLARAVEPAPSDRSIRRTAAGGRVLWQHDSAPFAAWLGPRFWIPSDNLVAELLLKELGCATAGAPGSDDNGIAFETAWLQTIGVDPATVTLADGSGLSQYDRITPRDLVAILEHDWNGPNRQLVLDSLPVGGARGTIEGIAGTPAAGRVFAKTGSMRHVRGLAGYLATRRHGAATFAFSVDDWNGDYAALAALRARVLARVVND